VLAMEKPEPEVAADLVRRIGSGDPMAEEELARRYSQGLLFHLRRMTGDPSLSDDLHQETFRVVLERLRGGAIADPGRLAGFILGTGRNLFLGGWRKQSRRGERDAVDVEELELLDAAPDPLEGVLREEEIREVRRLLRGLETDRDRQILFRFYVAEEKKDRICADLGLSSLHFNRVLFRARQRFKEMLAELGEPVR
jgi:RNA polymerase sigma-70 factor (ECF subfamily)